MQPSTRRRISAEECADRSFNGIEHTIEVPVVTEVLDARTDVTNCRAIAAKEPRDHFLRQAKRDMAEVNGEVPQRYNASCQPRLPSAKGLECVAYDLAQEGDAAIA
jgi:hypothetical protein